MKTYFPPNRYYTFGNTWVYPQAGHMIVGVTPHFLSATQPIAGIYISEPGIVFDEGDEVGYVTSPSGGKILIRLPFPGVLLDRNPLLVNRPQLLRRDPYGMGWVFSMEATDPVKIKQLLNARQYQEMASLLISC